MKPSGRENRHGEANWRPERFTKLLGGGGLALHVVTGVFPYAASGLLAPPWAYVVLYGIWALLLGFAIHLLRTGRQPWALVVPVASVIAWVGVISLGAAVLGWTA